MLGGECERFAKNLPLKKKESIMYVLFFLLSLIASACNAQSVETVPQEAAKGSPDQFKDKRLQAILSKYSKFNKEENFFPDTSESLVAGELPYEYGKNGGKPPLLGFKDRE
jgi:hypothetical protein